MESSKSGSLVNHTPQPQSDLVAILTGKADYDLRLDLNSPHRHAVSHLELTKESNKNFFITITLDEKVLCQYIKLIKDWTLPV